MFVLTVTEIISELDHQGNGRAENTNDHQSMFMLRLYVA